MEARYKVISAGLDYKEVEKVSKEFDAI